MWKVFNKDGAEKKAPVTVVNPIAVVSHSAAQTLPTGTTVALAMDTEIIKTDPGMHSSGANTRLVCTSPGIYMVTGAVDFSGSSAGSQRLVRLRKNGTTWVGESNVTAENAVADSIVTVTAVIPLSVGDYIELTAWQDTGGNLSANSAVGLVPTFSMVKVDGAVVSYVGAPGSIGQEVAYAEAAPGTYIATSAAETSGVKVVEAPAFTADGVSKYRIEFFTPRFTTSDSGNAGGIVLYENNVGTSLGQIANITGVGQGAFSVSCSREFVPTAGSHVYGISVIDLVGASSAHAKVQSGAGGANNLVPAYIRVTKVT